MEFLLELANKILDTIVSLGGDSKIVEVVRDFFEKLFNL